LKHIQNHPQAMKKILETQILIQASPERIWAILTNFKAYSEWNPFIKSIEGEVKVGNIIKALIHLPESQAMTFKPKVLVFEKNKEFRWLGHLFIKGIFDGEHIFELVDNGDGTTTFKHSEQFKGILVPLFSKMLDKNTRKGFILMNEKLKELAEK